MHIWHMHTYYICILCHRVVEVLFFAFGPVVLQTDLVKVGGLVLAAIVVALIAVRLGRSDP